MSVQYIDIDSTYRDRAKFPTPGEFVVSPNQNQGNTLSSAVSGVSIQAPIFPLPTMPPVTFYNVLDTPDQQTNLPIVFSPPLDTLSPNWVALDALPASQTNPNSAAAVVDTPTDKLYYPPASANNSYIGYYLQIIGDPKSYPITDYSYVNTKTVIQTLTVAADLGPITDTINSQFTVTSGSTTVSAIQHYYVGKLISRNNTTDPTIYTIISYDVTAGLTYTITVDQLPPVSIPWAAAEEINIIAPEMWIAHILPVNGNYPAVNPYGKSIDQYRVRSQIPVLTGTQANVDLLTSTITTIEFQPGFITVIGQYVGYYLWIYSTITNTVWINAIYNIVGSSPTDPTIYYIQQVWYDPNFQSSQQIDLSTLGNFNFEIWAFSSDQFHPLDMNGSFVIENQPVCYDVDLINISLPNLLLRSSIGNLIAFYPYVYVFFSQENNHVVNALYSNNPYAYGALFKVPITNVNQPESSAFVSMQGMGRQRIKFRINSTFFFKVILPDGEPFILDTSDNPPPLPANPNVQISAIFQLSRVVPYEPPRR